MVGWVGFGVPDWHEFQVSNGSITEYYGLWAYCQEQSPFFVSNCKRWSDAADQLFNGTRPSFVSTAEGLMTTGMVMISLGLIAGAFAALLPVICFVAGSLMAIGFVFLIIGLPIFGKESDSLSQLRGDANFSKRYGFWLMVPTIILAFISAILFFVAGVFYQRFGFGNIASHSQSRGPYGGKRQLGPANFLRGMPYFPLPGAYGNPYMYSGALGFRQPSLLSQYIAQRVPRYYSAPPAQRVIVTTLPQPTISRSLITTPTYVTPSYYRAPTIIRRTYTPVINLSGQTLTGPIIRSS